MAYMVETIMKDVYENLGIDYKTYVTTVNKQGVSIIP